MVDAAVPFREAIALAQASGSEESRAQVVATGAARATESAEATANIAASKGRARNHGDKSVGTPDPGAVSFSRMATRDRKSIRLNSSHVAISYAVFCLKKKNFTDTRSSDAAF